MNIKRFIINDLFGSQNVDITFEANTKILIGDNGLGKTTVLNAMYFLLSKKFDRLNKINFSTIELHLDNKKKIVIKKDELNFFVQRPRNQSGRSHLYTILTDKATKQNISDLKTIVDSKIPEQQKRLRLLSALRHFGLNFNAPSSFIYETVIKFLNEYEANGFLKTIAEIDATVDGKILYFPTYRRIEEDLKNIGFLPKREILEKYSHFLDEEDMDDISKRTLDDDVIQFGMTDVEERIKSLTQEITRSSVIGFSEITGEMLHQLLTNFPDTKTNNAAKLDVEKIQTILHRVGPNISQDDKDKIIAIIKTGKSTSANLGLIYFINKLIELYNKQEVLDISIKSFVDTCNGYLNGKKYIYNEREVSLKITRNGSTEEEVHLNQLSSGEKQIVSLFSKIYLEQDSNFIVLFDEPELSLSVFWQMKLLPDILNSGKCKFLFAVTHSPFIYDNDLAINAVGLNEYIFMNKIKK
ncbi:AAA family ATPase [Mucilaginibacter sp. McL0603]|uniref:AAA family ATPase n=1 Tax=Mucilaginibacter sp. McL0603 TaxID=3415670 RepID=UPI003CF13ABB